MGNEAQAATSGRAPKPERSRSADARSLSSAAPLFILLHAAETADGRSRWFYRTFRFHADDPPPPRGASAWPHLSQELYFFFFLTFSSVGNSTGCTSVFICSIIIFMQKPLYIPLLCSLSFYFYWLLFYYLHFCIPFCVFLPVHRGWFVHASRCVFLWSRAVLLLIITSCGNNGRKALVDPSCLIQKVASLKREARWCTTHHKEGFCWFKYFFFLPPFKIDQWEISFSDVLN